MRKGIKFLLIFTAAAAILGGCSKSRDNEDRNQGVELLEEGRYAEAVESFDKALSAEQADAGMERDLKCYKGTAQFKLREYSEAADTYSSIPDLDKDAEGLYLRGIARLYKEDEKDGISDLKKAAELADKDYEMLLDIYANLEKFGLESEGAGYLKIILKNVTGKKDVDYLRRGKAYYYSGAYDKALEELQTSFDKGALNAALFMGMVHEEQENYEKAVEVYKEYLKKNENDANVYNRIAVCKISLKDETAAEYIEAGLKLGETTAKQDLLYHEILLYEMKGDLESAAMKAGEYVSLYPEDKDAEREYKFLKTR